MLMVETELKPSAIHGLGVFLLEPVRRGQLIWRFDSRIDRVYSAEELEDLPALTQRYLRTYSTWHEASGLYVLCGDNGRYFNHSDRPTTVSNAISFGEDRAATDLEAGSELTSDYATICDDVRRNGALFVTATSAENWTSHDDRGVNGSNGQGGRLFGDSQPPGLAG